MGSQGDDGGWTVEEVWKLSGQAKRQTYLPKLMFAYVCLRLVELMELMI